MKHRDSVYIPGVAWRMADIRLDVMEEVFGLRSRPIIRRPVRITTAPALVEPRTHR